MMILLGMTPPKVILQAMTQAETILPVMILLEMTSGDDISGDDSGQDNSPVQKVSFSNEPTGLLGENVELDISYDALDMNNQLSGLGFRVHFDSSFNI